MFLNNTKKQYRAADNLVFSCQYHVIFCPKYRRKIFTEPYVEALKKKLYEIANDYSFSILDIEIMPDHVHLIIDCNPKFGIAECVKKLKAISSHYMREEFPELKKRLPTLWTRSVFIASVGDVSIESIEKYIEDQKGK